MSSYGSHVNTSICLTVSQTVEWVIYMCVNDLYKLSRQGNTPVGFNSEECTIDNVNTPKRVQHSDRVLWSYTRMQPFCTYSNV